MLAVAVSETTMAVVPVAAAEAVASTLETELAVVTAPVV
jgi:hypothetical protein